MASPQTWIKTRQLTAFILLLALGAAGAIVGYPVVHPEFVLFRQASVLLDKGEEAEAMNIAQRAWETGGLGPGYWKSFGDRALKRGMGSQALTAFDRALALDTKRPRRVSLSGLAFRLEAAGFPGLALELYQNHLSRLGDFAGRMHYADLLRRQGDLAGGVEAYATAAGLEGIGARERDLALMGRAETLGWMGRPLDGVELLRPVVDGDPDNRAARLLLARLLSWAGRTEEAVAQYKRLLGESE